MRFIGLGVELRLAKFAGQNWLPVKDFQQKPMDPQMSMRRL